jgi:hypothetical protein
VELPGLHSLAITFSLLVDLGAKVARARLAPSLLRKHWEVRQALHRPSMSSASMACLAAVDKAALARPKLLHQQVAVTTWVTVSARLCKVEQAAPTEPLPRVPSTAEAAAEEAAQAKARALLPASEATEAMDPQEPPEPDLQDHQELPTQVAEGAEVAVEAMVPLPERAGTELLDLRAMSSFDM